MRADRQLDGNPRGCVLRYKRRGRGARRRDRPRDQFGSGRRQPIDVIIGPTLFDCDVPALDITRLAEARAECRHEWCAAARR
jgi:hypothetical protein